MQLAHNVGQAKKSKNIIDIEKAEKELDNYKELVKSSDGMSLNYFKGDLL